MTEEATGDKQPSRLGVHRYISAPVPMSPGRAKHLEVTMEERIGLLDWVLINCLQEQPCDYTRSAAEWDWCNHEVYWQSLDRFGWEKWENI